MRTINISQILKPTNTKRMEKSNQHLLNLIIDEYNKVFQEIINGTLTEIPFGRKKMKKVFAIEKTGNWGLSTGKPRKDGRKGDTTSPYRLECIAKLGLFSEEDFYDYEGDLHKEVGYNSTDAKYIMIYLYNRVVQITSHLNIPTESQELGLEEYTITTEGTRMEVVVNRYERDRTIRNAFLATKEGDYSCEVCGFNFEAVYGELGKAFIHVHHKIPLFLIGKSYHPDIKKDFALVCPNCHAMWHRKDPPYNVDDLKRIIKSNEP